MRRARPPADGVLATALELEQREREIALLDRVRPVNFAAEQARLAAALQAGRQPTPAFVYAPAPDFGSLRRGLAELGRSLDPSDAEQRLLGERALELELEASLCEQVGDARFAALAARRFPLPDDPEPARRHANELVNAAELAPRVAAEPLHLSDDARDPDSLWSQLAKLISRELEPVRIELVPGLVSLAAVAAGVVRIRPGAHLTAATARRIALHEVEGHVRPRQRGKRLGGVFRAGASRASEDEEGRAILVEERADLLDGRRRRELGRRYLAAASVRQGAEFWETVTLLGGTGEAVELAARVHRGGGLGRELIYLTGYLRVAGALASRPELERVQESGRVSVRAAEALLDGSVELDDDRDVI